MINSRQRTRIAVITLFPEMFSAIKESGITRRAFEQSIVELELVNPRDFTEDKHRTVDDRPYGGGPGMVMKIEPLQKALFRCYEWFEAADTDIKRDDIDVFYMSPQGKRLENEAVKSLSDQKNIILIAGRYEGIDERFIRAHVSQEISIGDYVLSGGELPAMVLIDALVRRLPQALGHSESAEQDSFEDGLLDYPHFTRPEVFNGESVPEVLLCGDHKKIQEWRSEQSLKRTQLRRPDLLAKKIEAPEK